MSIQKLMVPFLNERSAEPAFSTASMLAERFKAHLDVVHMRQPISPAVHANMYYPVAIAHVEEHVQALKEAGEQQAEELKKLYDRLCQERDVGIFDEAEHTDDKGATAGWTDTEGAFPYELAARARLADLSVLAKSSRDAPSYELETIEEIIFQSGRPVLLVDSERPPSSVPDTIAVAWNGGKEATRAIAAALPILKQAKLVIVVSVGKLSEASKPPDQVASYLKLHGVHATHLCAPLGDGVDPEQEFLALAETKNADLIVMGAYSHNRWREVVLGGFTRFHLKKSQIPLFMAH